MNPLRLFFRGDRRRPWGFRALSLGYFVAWCAALVFMWRAWSAGPTWWLVILSVFLAVMAPSIEDLWKVPPSTEAEPPAR